MRKGGHFAWRVNGAPFRVAHNLLTVEGAAYLSDNEIVGATFAFGDPKFYVALWATDTAPLGSWTGATFAAAAGEINSITEGFVETLRPQWLPDAIVLDGDLPYVENFASPAEFNIRTASHLQICGAALLTANTIAGGADKLLAVVRFADAPVSFDNNDILDLRYKLELQR